jgi:hypothetical protein
VTRGDHQATHRITFRLGQKDEPLVLEGVCQLPDEHLKDEYIQHLIKNEEIIVIAPTATAGAGGEGGEDKPDTGETGTAGGKKGKGAKGKGAGAEPDASSAGPGEAGTEDKGVGGDPSEGPKSE